MKHLAQTPTNNNIIFTHCIGRAYQKRDHHHQNFHQIRDSANRKSYNGAGIIIIYSQKYCTNKSFQDRKQSGVIVIRSCEDEDDDNNNNENCTN